MANRSGFPDIIYTIEDLRTIIRTFRKDVDKGNKLLDQLFKHWNQYKDYGKIDLRFLRLFCKQSTVSRRILLLTKFNKAPNTRQIELAMKHAARGRLREATIRNFRNGLIAELAGTYDGLNVRFDDGRALNGFEYAKELNESAKNRWENIRSSAEKIRGEKLATDAMRDFEKFVAEEAELLKKTDTQRIYVQTEEEKALIKALKETYKKVDISSDYEFWKDKENLVNKIRCEAILDKVSKDTKSTLGMLSRKGKLSEADIKSFRTTLKFTFDDALRAGGYLFEGLVAGFVIDLVIEEVLNFWEKALRNLAKEHECVEEALQYEIIMGVNVERIGYNLYSQDVDLWKIIPLLLLRMLGKIIGKSSEEDVTFSQIVDATLANNPDSIVVNNSQYQPAKLTATAINAIKTKTAIIYQSDRSIVGSNCIDGVAYRFDKQELIISFYDKHKTSYHFKNVPVGVIIGFMNAPKNAASIGAYFNYYIRPYYKEYSRFENDNVHVGNNPAKARYLKLKKAAGGKDARLERNADINRVNEIIDEPTPIIFPPEILLDKEKLLRMAHNAGAIGYIIDKDGYYHLSYYR